MTIGLYILAILPCLAIILWVYIRDRYERESLYIYLLCISLGIACAWLSYHLSNLTSDYLKTRPHYSLFMEVFIAIAFIEELTRFVLFRIFLYHNKNFNEAYDGIVYGVTMAMGFAAVENILYLQSYPTVELALLRMVTTVPAHGVFGAYMGYFMSRSKFSATHKMLLRTWAVLASTIIHGAYDIFIFMDGNPNWIFMSVLILVVFLIYEKRLGSYLLKISSFKKQ